MAEYKRQSEEYKKQTEKEMADYKKQMENRWMRCCKLSQKPVLEVRLAQD